MSERGRDVLHYSRRGRHQHARRVSPDALALTDLTVRHGDVLAVDGLDLHVGRGETVALLGPNGAGKSTTVSAVLGLLHPDAGTVRVLGRTPADAVRAGCVGAMLQHGGLPGEARVDEVLHLVRRSYPDPWPLDDAVADRVVVMAGGRVVADGPSAAVRSAVAGRTVRFSAPDGATFDRVPGVTGATRLGGTVALATTDVEATLRALLADGVALTDLEVRGASLEDAVLSLVGGVR